MNGYKKQELWLTLIQKRGNTEIARTQPFRVNPESTIGQISDVEETLKKMSGPTITWDWASDWRDIEKPDMTLIDGTGRGSRG